MTVRIEAIRDRHGSKEKTDLGCLAGRRSSRRLEPWMGRIKAIGRKGIEETVVDRPAISRATRHQAHAGACQDRGKADLGHPCDRSRRCEWSGPHAHAEQGIDYRGNALQRAEHVVATTAIDDQCRAGFSRQVVRGSKSRLAELRAGRSWQATREGGG